MEINGVPAHALVVHVAVVFIPLAALVSIVYALVPRWRWLTRWPSIVLALVAPASAGVAVLTGRDLKQELVDRVGAVSSAVALHQERAEVLFWITVAFGIVVLLAGWGLGGPSPLTSGRGARGHHDRLVEWSLVLGVVVFALMAFAMTVAAGDAGARAVWVG